MDFVVAIGVLAFGDEGADLRSIVVVGHPELVTNHSSPVPVEPHCAVANQNVLKFDGGILGKDLVGHEGNVHTTVGFAGDPEIVRFEFGELDVEGLHGFERILGSSRVVPFVVGSSLIENPTPAGLSKMTVWALNSRSMGS
jgi:hypothetical protein